MVWSVSLRDKYNLKAASQVHNFKPQHGLTLTYIYVCVHETDFPYPYNFTVLPLGCNAIACLEIYSLIYSVKYNLISKANFNLKFQYRSPLTPTCLRFANPLWLFYPSYIIELQLCYTTEYTLTVACSFCPMQTDFFLVLGITEELYFRLAFAFEVTVL